MAYIEELVALRERIRAGFAAVLGAIAGAGCAHRLDDAGCQIVLTGLDLGPEDEVVTTTRSTSGCSARCRRAARASSWWRRTRTRSSRPSRRGRGCSPSPMSSGRPGRSSTSPGSARPGCRFSSTARSRPARSRPISAAPTTTRFPLRNGFAAWSRRARLYVRDPESLAVALPTYFGQASHESDGSYVPRDGARRFDSGWISGPVLAGLEASLACHPEWRYEPPPRWLPAAVSSSSRSSRSSRRRDSRRSSPSTHPATRRSSSPRSTSAA